MTRVLKHSDERSRYGAFMYAFVAVKEVTGPNLGTFSPPSSCATESFSAADVFELRVTLNFYESVSLSCSRGQLSVPNCVSSAPLSSPLLVTPLLSNYVVVLVSVPRVGMKTLCLTPSPKNLYFKFFKNSLRGYGTIHPHLVIFYSSDFLSRRTSFRVSTYHQNCVNSNITSRLLLKCANDILVVNSSSHLFTRSLAFLLRLGIECLIMNRNWRSKYMTTGREDW